jgi:hypothetical protein
MHIHVSYGRLPHAWTHRRTISISQTSTSDSQGLIMGAERFGARRSSKRTSMATLYASKPPLPEPSRPKDERHPVIIGLFPMNACCTQHRLFYA